MYVFTVRICNLFRFSIDVVFQDVSIKDSSEIPTKNPTKDASAPQTSYEYQDSYTLKINFEVSENDYNDYDIVYDVVIYNLGIVYGQFTVKSDNIQQRRLLSMKYELTITKITQTASS